MCRKQTERRFQELDGELKAPQPVNQSQMQQLYWFRTEKLRAGMDVESDITYSQKSLICVRI
jgi:hypothetical protein